MPTSKQPSQSFPVMLAEDNPVSRKLLKKILTKAGYEVSAAANGREALTIFNKNFFPIVVTDWMMPEMNGIELCRAIRQKTKSSGYVFIIILTGKDTKNDIIEGLAAGADDYLTKPFNKSELIARLNTANRILKLEQSLLKANQKIKKLSIIDTLTGCYNRSYLTEHLEYEIKRSIRYKTDLSILLCDIDHFKKVNDTYGHQTGDVVLKEFVKCIQGQIRNDVDWIARYGGEEFLIVFPETKLSHACVVAERLRLAISKMSIKTIENKIQITASFGVFGLDSNSPDKNISAEELINVADKYLYQSKNAGRNKVTSETQ
jgi:diguanylate cyclase (GGDEF)-like protein